MTERPSSTLDSRIAWALLCAFVFSIPWEKSVLIEPLGTFSHLLGILAFAATAIAAAHRRSLRLPNLALVLAAVFVLWAALTWFWSLDRQATARRVITLSELLGMTWLIWESARNRARHVRLMECFVWGATAASIAAMLRYWQGLQTYYRRYAARGFDPNDFGLVLALAIPLALYLALQSRGWTRWLFRAAVLVLMAAILLTASRTALIATFIAFGFAFWTWRGADRAHRIASVLLLILMILGLYRFAPAPARQRLATISAELTQGTLHNRTVIWKAGLKVLRQNPVLGIGAGAYPGAVRPWIGTPGVAGHQYVAHNTFLSVLVECGAVGFLLYSLMLGTLVLFVWTLPSSERALWTIVLLVWAAGVSTLTWEHYKPSWLLAALIMTEWGRPWRAAG